MRRSWIVTGWLVALVASALPPMWFLAARIEENPLGKYVDPTTGAWLPHVYWKFLAWWLPIAVPVSLLALACMFLNWPRDPR